MEEFFNELDRIKVMLKYPPSPFRDKLIPEDIRELVGIYRFALTILEESKEEEAKDDAIALIVDVAGALAQKKQYGYVDAVNEFIIAKIGWEKAEKIILSKIKMIEDKVDSLMKMPSGEEKERETFGLHCLIAHYSMYIFTSDTYYIGNLANAILPTMETFAQFLAIRDGEDWDLPDLFNDEDD